MKRLLAAAVAAVLAAGAFANTEFDLSFTLAPLTKYNIDGDLDGDEEDISLDDITMGCPLGIDCQWGKFFGSPTDFLDLGMGISVGTDFFTKYTVENDYEDLDIDGFGVRFSFTLGPAVRFNLGEMQSIYVCPGLALGLTGMASSDASLVAFDVGFNLDAGYRLWFVRHSDSKFGLAVGLDLTFPFAGKFACDCDAVDSGEDDYDYSNYPYYYSGVDDSDAGGVTGDINGGAELKINIGLCFNFD